jgi:hypothetical protein
MLKVCPKRRMTVSWREDGGDGCPTDDVLFGFEKGDSRRAFRLVGGEFYCQAIRQLAYTSLGNVRPIIIIRLL